MAGEREIDERLWLLEKSVASLADELENVRLQLSGDVEAQHIDITALKDFLHACFPDFQTRFSVLRDSTIRADRPSRAAEDVPSGA